MTREETIVLAALADHAEWVETLAEDSVMRRAYERGRGLDHIVGATGMHRRAVRRALGRLEETGSIARSEAYPGCPIDAVSWSVSTSAV